MEQLPQNVQGTIKSEAPAPDLTGGRYDPVEGDSDCVRRWVLAANLCNRGAAPVPAGVAGTFYVGDPRAGGKKICTTHTLKPLPPATCETVRCDYADPPRGSVDLWFVADDDGSGMGMEAECKEHNNLLHVPDAACVKLG